MALDMKALMKSEWERYNRKTEQSEKDTKYPSSQTNSELVGQSSHTMSTSTTSIPPQLPLNTIHPEHTLPNRMRIPADKSWRSWILQTHNMHVPPDIAYIPDFLSSNEEEILLKCIYTTQYEKKWVHLKRRRLQNWGGVPQLGGLEHMEKLPRWLESTVDTLVDSNIFDESIRPNHVLVNEYKPGEGIMMHADGPLYTPFVAIISLGSSTLFRFRRQSMNASKNSSDAFSVLVQPKSLLLFTKDAYDKYLHGIEEVTVDEIEDTTLNAAMSEYKVGDHIPRGTRTTLTIRHVPSKSNV